tara:strand:- start:2883 stop:4811 length:1929 start_codon:yes stop_codon:yes gene_type:complete
MSKIKLTGESSGYVEISAGASAGNNTLDLPSGKVKLVGADSSDNIVVGVATGSNFKTGSSNLHSTGLSVGDTLLHTTGLNVGTGVTIHSPASNILTLGTNDAERLRINSSGNVGINSTSPSTPLELYTDISSAWKFRINTSVSDGAGFYQRSNGDFEMVLRDASNNNNYIAGTSGALQFAASGSEKLRITGIGSVGIGQNDPDTLLHLTKDNANPYNTPVTLLKLHNGGGNQGSTSRLEFKTGAATCYIENLIGGANSNSGADLTFATPSSATVGTERMRITSTGHLGIGTDGISSRLTVSEDAGRVLRVGKNYFGVFQTDSGWTNRPYTENPIILWDYNSTHGDNLYFSSGGNTPHSQAMAMIIGDEKGVVVGRPSYNGTDTNINMTHANTFFRVQTSGKVDAGGGINFATNGFGNNYSNHSDYGFTGGGETDGVLYRGVGQAYLAVDDLFRIRDNIDNSENKKFEFNTNDGSAGADAAFDSNNFDFAEMFEWSDGNPDAEDRIGYSVCVDTLTGKVRKAEEGDTPFGIVSGTASFVANAGHHKWAGYAKRDEWGRPLQEPAYNGEGEPLLDAEGNHRTKMAVNPDWDESLVHTYVSRFKRPEWACVGVMGQVYMRKGCPVDSRWVKLKEIDSVKDLWLVR